MYAITIVTKENSLFIETKQTRYKSDRERTEYVL